MDIFAKSSHISSLASLRPVFEIQTQAASYSLKYSNWDPCLLSASDESGEIYVISLSERPEISGQLHAHNNSIFHVGWSGDDKYLLTGSGDQTAGVWDLQRFSGSLLVKHTGSVKCIKNSPVSASVYATASRDGKIYIWDLRTYGAGSDRNSVFEPVAEITKRSEVKERKRKEPASFTGLEYLHWGNAIVSVEADEAGMRFWDVRKSESLGKAGSKNRNKSANTNKRSKPCMGMVTPWTYRQEENLKGLRAGRQKGVFDYTLKKNNEIGPGNSWICSGGTSLLVSSMSNSLYLYEDVLRLDSQPPIKYVGHKTSFYVKACIDPEGTCVASGSSEGSLLIWEISKPEQPVTVQTRYLVESSCVDWTRSNQMFMASSSDAAVVTLWDCSEELE